MLFETGEASARLSAGALRSVLRAVQPVVPSKTPQPAFRCVRFEAEGSVARVSATDGEVAVTLWAPAAIHGTVCPEFERLAALVKLLRPDQEVRLAPVQQPAGAVRVRYGTSDLAIGGVRPDDFPSPPDWPARSEAVCRWAVPAGPLLDDALVAGRGAGSYFNGFQLDTVWIGPRPDRAALGLVSTDGCELVRCAIPASCLTPEVEPRPILVPPSALTVLHGLARHLALDESAEVGLAVEADRRCQFTLPGATVDVVGVEGRYPGWTKVVPWGRDQFPAPVVQLLTPDDRDEFLRLVRLAAVTADKDHQSGVLLDVRPSAAGAPATLTLGNRSQFGSAHVWGEFNTAGPDAAHVVVPLDPKRLLRLIDALRAPIALAVANNALLAWETAPVLGRAVMIAGYEQVEPATGLAEAASLEGVPA